MPEEFTCKVVAGSASPVLRLGGEFDLAAVDVVERELASVIGSRPKAVIVDLQDVTFIDSTALEVLAQLNATAEADGFKLWITGGNGDLNQMFRITGLDSVLPLVDQVPDPAA